MDIFILIVSICMGKSIRNTRGQHQNAYLHSELFVLLQCDGVANKLVQAFVDKDNPEKACEDVGLCTAVAFGKFFTKNKKTCSAKLPYTILIHCYFGSMYLINS